MDSNQKKSFGGRKKGSKNKLPMSVKQSLIRAYSEMGGDEALAAWGRRNPTEFYKIWVKLMPTQVEVGKRVEDMTTLELKQEAQELLDSMEAPIEAEYTRVEDDIQN